DHVAADHVLADQHRVPHDLTGPGPVGLLRRSKGRERALVAVQHLARVERRVEAIEVVLARDAVHNPAHSGCSVGAGASSAGSGPGAGARSAARPRIKKYW